MAEPMRALSLWQPWATLIALGAKAIETRPWATRYRGPIAIHAAKRWTGDLAAICHLPRFDRVLSRQVMPLGGVVAVADLVECWEIGRHGLSAGAARRDLPEGDERHFGDYGVGRFAWELSRIRPLQEPVPLRGRQGLWKLSREEEAEILDRAAREVAHA